MSELNKQIAKATKWSAMTEIMSRLLGPISSMVLARLLTPDAFGVVTTVMMIVSFAEVFSDAGFQKYIIQHEFQDETELEQNTNVAFWSNFTMSMLLWGIIALFNQPLAKLVGNEGLGYVLVIACISIPLMAFSSIQMARYKRSLDFKTLFKVKLVGILIPLFVTIPFAIWLRSFWALIIGHIAKDLINAVVLTYYSAWRPRLYYSFQQFKEMFSFTIWSLFEALSIWLTAYVDVFIVGAYLNQHYLGLYKTSMVVVGYFTATITAATTPILFSSLSRLQNNDEEFKKLYFKFQKTIGLLMFPLCFGIFCFRDLVTEILLGEKWMETSGFIGLWALTSCFVIVMSHYTGEVLRSKGKPKLSTMAQLLHIVVLCPAIAIAVRYDYTTLYVTRSLIRIELIAVNLFFLYSLIRISLSQIFLNIFPALVSSCVMAFFSKLLLNYTTDFVMQILSAIIASLIYLCIVMMFNEERNLLLHFTKTIKK